MTRINFEGSGSDVFAFVDDLEKAKIVVVIDQTRGDATIDESIVGIVFYLAVAGSTGHGTVATTAELEAVVKKFKGDHPGAQVEITDDA